MLMQIQTQILIHIPIATQILIQLQILIPIQIVIQFLTLIQIHIWTLIQILFDVHPYRKPYTLNSLISLRCPKPRHSTNFPMPVP